MNIFYVDASPIRAATMLCDKHVVKMTLESAQLLSTAHGESGPYKPAYPNHPCAVWTRASTGNYAWLYAHFFALAKEYEHRYGRVHKSWSVCWEILQMSPDNLPVRDFCEPPQCMPDKYKCESTIAAYRAYYRGDKARLCKYTRSAPPSWLADLVVG